MNEEKNFTKIRCRLCINQTEPESLMMISEKVCVDEMKPEDLINKFNIIKLHDAVPLKKICQSCVKMLETFYKFHLDAVLAQNKLIEAFKCDKPEAIYLVDGNQPNDEKDGPENLTQSRDQEQDNDTFDESEGRDELKLLLSLQCEYCSKSHKRQSHLDRHIERNHQDQVDGKRKAHRWSFCNLCGRKFSLQERYESHLKDGNCVPSENPKCRFCKETFSEISKLKEHLISDHPRGREHTCPICFKSFPTVSNRNSHLQSHNPENFVTCLICGQGFKSVLYLRKHQKAIHIKTENTCAICDRKFDTQQKFDYHMGSHEAVKRYKCSYPGCDKSFMQHHHLENHKTTHTGINNFLCFKCGKKFRQECNLKSHLKTHGNDNERKFSCSFPDCRKSFKSNSTLLNHKKSHEKSSQCPECGKKFSQRASFRAHFQTHFQDPLNKPFKCQQPNCDRSFFQQRSIKYHLSAAHGIGNPVTPKRKSFDFACDFCEKTFKLQSLVKRHILTHIEEERTTRKHQCDKCEASFKRPEHLRLHVNSVHLKYKPYKCEHFGCKKSFAQIGDRNVHMKVHLNEKPHVCSICQKAFRLSKGLRAHEKTHGNDTKKEAQTRIDETGLQVFSAETDQQKGSERFNEESTNTQAVYLVASMS